ncbi:MULTISPECIES: hypothetical protein [Streptomyces]|uniref:hypothetical protein n=1 Tax=Streptomyces TaxID=1883 RepID=UPI00163D1E9F|nr:hypothetical protein [Streptomyces sp. WAC06128]
MSAGKATEPSNARTRGNRKCSRTGDEFKRAAAEARHLYINSAREEDKKGLETAFSEERVRVAFNVYKAAQWAMESHKDKGLIAGNRLDQDEVIATEKIPGIDAEVIKNFRTLSEATERGVGQVLDSSKWTIVVNDAWLLGGAHYMAQVVEAVYGRPRQSMVGA